MAKKLGDNTPTENYARLQQILLTLPKSQERSLKQLTEELCCSKQTVLRLLEKMASTPFGKLVTHKVGRENMYSFARASRTPQVALSPKGLEDLKMCRDFMADILPASITEAMDGALVSAQAYLHDRENAAFVSLGESFRKGRIDYARFDAQIQTIRACIRRELVCQITYRKALGKDLRQLEIAPLRLVPHNDAMYVRAWVVTDRGEVRAKYDKPGMFAVQRIEEVFATCRSSAKLPNAPWSPGFGLLDEEPMPVCIRFSPTVATYVSERQWSGDQTIEAHKDGSLTLRMTSTSKRELAAWVLSFGREATLLEPTSLRQELASEMRQMLGMYGE